VDSPRITKEIKNQPAEYRLRREIPLFGATDGEVQALFATSLREARQLGSAFDNLRYYCTFIGYPRSGHSLIGSLMDAHPNMIIGHELDALLFINSGFSDRQLFYLLLENSRIFAQHGRIWGAYSYAVPNQHQGRYTELQVIGDKKGGGTTDRIRQDWQLLAKLMSSVGVTHRFIHVVRNPFDNIATIAKRRMTDVTKIAEWYLALSRTNQRLRSEFPEHVMDIYYEDFLHTPTTWLARLCEFLGVVADENYLNACCGIINSIPHRSRHDVIWPASTRQLVEREMQSTQLLRRYSFDN
jgi:sulfotransferase family protein